jgi:hypothetical protein
MVSVQVVGAEALAGKLDRGQPVCYALQFRTLSTLVVLDEQARVLGLPLPLAPLAAAGADGTPHAVESHSFFYLTRSGQPSPLRAQPYAYAPRLARLAAAVRADPAARGHPAERPAWARERSARQSEWSAGRDWRRMPVMQAALPDLQRRARLLLALHPFLAHEAWSNDLLPESIIDWKDRLATLPSGASFAALIESIREPDPQLAATLEAEAAADRGLLSDLDPAEVKREFEGALNQLRLQRVREEIDRLAAGGLQSDADRARYADLQSMRKALTSG